MSYTTQIIHIIINVNIRHFKKVEKLKGGGGQTKRIKGFFENFAKVDRGGGWVRTPINQKYFFPFPYDPN